jgi:electron transfer flavoprotein alpha subunit
MAAPILIFVEQRKNTIHAGSLQLFTAARDLKNAGGGEVHAIVLGHDVASVTQQVSAFGADVVHVVDNPALEHYRARPYTAASSHVVATIKPGVVLLATTSMGRDLAPRIAMRNNATLCTDCQAILTEGNTIRVRRTMYSGRCVAEKIMTGDSLRIISVRPNAYALPQPMPGPASQVSTIAIEPAYVKDDVEVVEITRTGGEIKDVTEADIVVSGGRSLKSEENFRIIHELAAALDGAVGASRAAVDAGYQPHSRQIGLTGKTVTPRLYIACGIDGAIQHLAGMRGSKVIVAINTRRDAPIFNHATYGCVADLFTLVPLLTEEARRLKAQ